MIRSLLLPLLLGAHALPAAAVVVARPGAPASGLPAGPAYRWTLAPGQMLLRHEAAKASLEAALGRIAAVPAAEARFENTVLAFERAQSEWVQQWLPLRFLAEVSPDPAVREAARAIERDVDAVSIALGQREDLYRLFEAAAAKGEALGEADARLLEATLRGFRNSGMGLAPEQREKLKGLQERLAAVANQFSRNINEHQDFLELGAEQAAGLGLPEDYLASLPRAEDGRVRVGLDYPSYFPFMRYAKDASLRRALREKYERRAAPANLPLVKEALELRRDMAALLGEPSFPALALKDRMAKTPEAVKAFLDRVARAVLPRARAELAELLALKRRDDPSARRVESWDQSYYGRILREERHALDSNLVKEYFPVDRVIEGTLRVYQRVLGVRFREVEGAPLWHPDARAFEISDADGRRIGHFYLDLYPRESKYGHAAAFPLSLGMRGEDGAYVEPVAAMVANFPKPAPGRPALLPHGDVETFFHEFGHLMHQTLTKAEHASQSGSSVARDFVEGPSQMLEEFVWRPEVLAELSGHWRTGEPLPEELLAKMLGARGLMSAAGYAYQAALASADLSLHLLAPADPSDLFNRIVSDLTGIEEPPGAHPVASFDHLMGYESGYYGYLWSKVFALDMFSRFAGEGVLSPEAGAAYRRSILETGSRRPELDSLLEFLGREPSEEAFARELEQGPAPSSVPPLSFPDLAELAERQAAVYDAVHAAGGVHIHSLRVRPDEGDPSIPVWTVVVNEDTPLAVMQAVRAAMDPLPGLVRVRKRAVAPSA